MNITISPKIKRLTPSFHMAVMTCDVKIYDEEKITSIIKELENEIEESIQIEDVVNLPIIVDGRNAYKAYGKDPSRYRLAVESLYRRLSKGNTLYRINNVVDLGNILSIKTRKSVAVLDLEKIKGNIVIRLGSKDDHYEGIGRGSINIENIPLYEDSIGPFGSVTSDTERTMIRPTTKKILLFIISFSGEQQLHDDMDLAKELYTKYAKATNIKTNII